METLPCPFCDAGDTAVVAYTRSVDWTDSTILFEALHQTVVNGKVREDAITACTDLHKKIFSPSPIIHLTELKRHYIIIPP